MTEFHDQDLGGSRFERVNLADSHFTRVRFTGAEMRATDFTDVRIDGAMFHGARLRGVELAGVRIDGDLRDVVVNGVDIAPLVEAELDRRMPDRVRMRPDDAEGFREAWSILERLWEETVARAKMFPEADLHRSVDGEWSFVETLRHLGFATAAWVGRGVLGESSPWHPWDLPWDQAPGWEGIPWDRRVRPPLDEVLALRAERQAMVRGVLASLTDARLAEEVTRTEPGWPRLEGFPLKTCLRIVLNEEWEHRRFAERDLSILEGGSGAD
ncbi:pentapeptide repeat protein [Stackebrandtia albiflava]|uniref:Pentapeptide repeat protein n=1 Tax=Stackebrandtia albiflava TaxID=406432 RepID=A0A562V9G5_9ACTN|nr:DinB family protein [Stackebrandtia albiflava]TWJ14524.1 pentapeptide repeat protein [Stackebrandtia albiflava]